VPWRIPLAQTDDAYALLREFEAFPSGLRFAMFAMFRDPDVLYPGRGRPAPVFVHEIGPRFGVEFADGRRAVTGIHHNRPDQPGNEAQPILRTGGGGSFGGTSRLSFWLWPLPPPGPLTWHATWPDRALSDSSVEVDASVLAEAAEQAQQLWNSEPGAGGSSIIATAE
jgi:hypothetical protein